jgi:OOP family OmpA-OmpF porin
MDTNRLTPEAVLFLTKEKSRMPLQSNIRRWVAAGAAVLAVAPVWAQSSPSGRPYVGLSVGQPDWRTDNLAGVSSGSNSGTGFKLYGGYAFNPNFALEAGGVSLGKLRGTGGDVKADGLYLDAVGMLPLNPQWSLLGRAGVVNSRVRSSTLGSERGTSGKLGLGVQYNLNANTSIRGEWERYGLKAFGEKPKVDLYTVGVNVAF